MSIKAITDERDRNAEYISFMQRQLAAKDKEALMSLLRSKNGRWFLMRLLDKTKINSDTFTGNSHTFYNEGMRRVGISILQDISALGMDAVKLKQRAELEYVRTQLDAQAGYDEYVRGEEE